MEELEDFCNIALTVKNIQIKCPVPWVYYLSIMIEENEIQVRRLKKKYCCLTLVIC